jgi:hypothetical protein
MVSEHDLHHRICGSAASVNFMWPITQYCTNFEVPTLYSNISVVTSSCLSSTHLACNSLVELVLVLILSLLHHVCLVLLGFLNPTLIYYRYYQFRINSCAYARSMGWGDHTQFQSQHGINTFSRLVRRRRRECMLLKHYIHMVFDSLNFVSYTH